VVLEPGKDDFVAGSQHRTAVTLRHEIDAVGRALRQNDRLRIRRVDERRRLAARTFIQRRRTLAQKMRGTMDVRVRVAVVLVHRVENNLRLLARVGAVEIDERLAVHTLQENREVAPHLLHVEPGAGVGRGGRG
jgi:hypothetical protein